MFRRTLLTGRWKLRRFDRCRVGQHRMWTKQGYDLCRKHEHSPGAEQD
jgi:hypothetical protein